MDAPPEQKPNRPPPNTISSVNDNLSDTPFALVTKTSIELPFTSIFMRFHVPTSRESLSAAAFIDIVRSRRKRSKRRAKEVYPDVLCHPFYATAPPFS